MASAALLAAVGVPAAAEPELVVLHVPAEVAASTEFAIRVRVTNSGIESIGPCRVQAERVRGDGPCILLGYRFWRTPKRHVLASVDTVPLLREEQSLAPGESMERTIVLLSPRGGPRGADESTLNLYMIRGPDEPLRWARVTVPVSVGPAPARVRVRQFVTRVLLAVYVSGVLWSLWRALRGMRWPRRACSS